MNSYIKSINRDIEERKKRKMQLAEYSLIISKYFSSVLGNIELFKDFIDGESNQIDNTLHTAIAVKGKFNTDENEFNDWIYCYLTQKDKYYCASINSLIYFNYKDICYEINIESINYEHEKGIYRVFCNICFHNKSDFDLGYNSLFAYHDGNHQKQRKLNGSSRTYYELTIDKNSNIITEVIKMYKKTDNEEPNLVSSYLDENGTLHNTAKRLVKKPNNNK